MRDALSFDRKAAIIERYGPGHYRLGVEGEWVTFIQFFEKVTNTPAKLSRDELLREIDDMNRKRQEGGP
jgi:hypothetical protein